MVRKGLLMVLCMAALTSLSACQWMPLAVKPKPLLMKTKAPEGSSPLFAKGWEQGCETGLAMFGDNNYKTMYSFTQDPDLVLNKEYYRGWEMGQLYCRVYIYRFKNRSAIGE